MNFILEQTIKDHVKAKKGTTLLIQKKVALMALSQNISLDIILLA